MLDPGDVRNIVADAARLARRGEVVVFGSAALAFWLDSAPATRDVDLYCLPPERGDAVEALMGELSRYHEHYGAYVEVWGPETFLASQDWRARAKVLRFEESPDVAVVIAHPHDVMVAKLERCDERDRQHILAILDELPLPKADLETLLSSSAHERGEIDDDHRVASFRHWATWLEGVVDGRE